MNIYYFRKLYIENVFFLIKYQYEVVFFSTLFFKERPFNQRESSIRQKEHEEGRWTGNTINKQK